MINVSDLKPGVTFQLDGNLYVVLDYSHNKTARAAANIKVKMKNLRTGSTTELTFGGNDKVKRAQIDKKEMQYLYKEGKDYVMMDNETYEQIQLTEDQVGDGIKYLKENMIVQVLKHDTRIIGVDIPAHVELEVVDTPPAEKGNTAQGGTKPATLETGAVVQVPFFVSNGDVIRVDTRSNEYLDLSLIHI